MPKRTSNVPAGVEINGGKLRELRKLQGDTLEAFAAKCDISFGYLGQVERQARPRVSPIIFVRLCDALAIPAESRTTLLTAAARRRVAQVA